MKEFLCYILTKLGLGKGAIMNDVFTIDNQLHNFLGYDFNSYVMNPTTIHIMYNNENFYEDFYIVYDIVDSRVKDIYIIDKI